MTIETSWGRALYATYDDAPLIESATNKRLNEQRSYPYKKA